MEEHINDTESHYSDECPGVMRCACAHGLRSLLDGLDNGSIVIRQVTQ